MINGTWARFEMMLSAPPTGRAPDPNALIDQVTGSFDGSHPMHLGDLFLFESGNV